MLWPHLKRGANTRGVKTGGLAIRPPSKHVSYPQPNTNSGLTIGNTALVRALNVLEPVGFSIVGVLGLGRSIDLAGGALGLVSRRCMGERSMKPKSKIDLGLDLLARHLHRG